MRLLVQRKINVLLLVILAMSVFAGRQALAAPDETCIPVQAKINALFNVAGCASPVGLCTTGQITDGGIFNGETRFTALSIAPAAGMHGIEPDTTLSFHGVLEIITQDGALYMRGVGVFDQVVGVYSEVDRITAGIGRFESARGTLFIYGDAFEDGSGIDGEVRGQVCLMPAE
jgi:hypothetical protein